MPVTVLAQTPPRPPDEIINDLENNVNELKQSVGQPGPVCPTGEVCTPQDLVVALARCDGQQIKVRPGIYYVNGVWACPGTTPMTQVVGVENPPLQDLVSPVNPASPWKTGTQAVVPGSTAAVSIYPADGKLPSLTVLGSNVTFKGITFGAGILDSSTVVLGSATAKDPLLQPDNVTFDSVEVIAGPAGGFRGFEIHSRGVKITRSRVTGYRHTQRDAQAIYVCNGPGPHVFDSNFLEASGENVLFGGCTTMTQAMHPVNPQVTNNYVYKPQTWRPNQPLYGLVKNLVECKSCDGGLVKGNVLDGNWVNGQAGTPLVFTPRDQYKASPWTVVRNITVENNVVFNSPQGYCMSFLYLDDVGPSQPTENITIQHNLCADSPSGIQFVGGIKGKTIVENNSFPKVRYNLVQFANAIQDFTTKASGFTKLDLTYTKNVGVGGEYGLAGQAMNPGLPSYQGFTLPSSVFTNNVIEKTSIRPITWPSGNTLLNPGALAGQLDPNFKYKPDSTLGW